METVKVNAVIPRAVHSQLSDIAKTHKITIGALASRGVVQFAKEIRASGLLHKFPTDKRKLIRKGKP